MFDAAINRDTNNLVAAVLGSRREPTGSDRVTTGADGVRQGYHSKLPQ